LKKAFTVMVHCFIITVIKLLIVMIVLMKFLILVVNRMNTGHMMRITVIVCGYVLMVYKLYEMKRFVMVLLIMVMVGRVQNVQMNQMKIKIFAVETAKLMINMRCMMTTIVVIMLNVLIITNKFIIGNFVMVQKIVQMVLTRMLKHVA